MAEMPAVLLPHTVDVEPFAGDGSEGPTYGAQQPVRCRREGRIDVTADGQHVGSVKVYARLAARTLLNAGARVTFPDGTTGTVQATAEHVDGSLGAWQHLEVTVTGEAR